MAPVVIRENRWVKVYQLRSGSFIDSKFRLLECDADPDDVIRAWDLAAEEERRDIQAAPRFCNLPNRSRIVEHIEKSDPTRAQQIAENFAVSNRPLTEEEFQALSEVISSYDEAEIVAGQRLILETEWFRVFAVPTGGYSYESVRPMEDSDFDALLSAARGAPPEHQEHYLSFHAFWRAMKRA
jgi:hypothetical protein